jgi:UPF0755 protein
MKSLLKKKYRVVAITTFILLLVAGVAMGTLIASPAGRGEKVELITCGKGAPFAKVARGMEEKGLIDSSRMLVLYARILGDDSKVQAGTYQFNDSMTPLDMLRMMVNGEVFTRKFALPEGYSIFQIAEMLDSRGLMNKRDFLKQCFDKELLGELNIPGKSVEGYLQPCTYNIPLGMDASGLIRMMVKQFENSYNDRFAGREKGSGLSRHAILTLASLIEKEARVATERPLIASVFHNRIKKRMRLQSDPTAVYGVRAFGGNVTKQDIRRRNPYNTYLIDGLPPGPIGNPGSDAIESVLTPARTDYLYFVAKKDGTHFFSSSLGEHNRAVNRYLRSSSFLPAGTVVTRAG